MEGRRIITDTQLRRFVGYEMKMAFNAIQADVNRTLEPHGLRLLTFSVMMIVSENPNLRAADLAEALAMKRSNVVAVIDELSAAHLLVRKPAEGDRRALALHLTPLGETRLEAAIRDVEGHDARMTARLTAAETATLRRALGCIEEEGKTSTSRPMT